MGALGTPGDAPPFDISSGVLDGLYRWVANLGSERPPALCIDDAHLADSPSLCLLGQLLRRIEGLRLRSSPGPLSRRSSAGG
jgi:hypothetical protein